jgi:hypothetical protein
MYDILELIMIEFYLNYECIDGEMDFMPQQLQFTPGKEDEGEYCGKNGRSSPDTVAF